MSCPSLPSRLLVSPLLACDMRQANMKLDEAIRLVFLLVGSRGIPQPQEILDGTQEGIQCESLRLDQPIHCPTSRYLQGRSQEWVLPQATQRECLAVVSPRSIYIGIRLMVGMNGSLEWLLSISPTLKLASGMLA
jgi:hypothetical protein